MMDQTVCTISLEKKWLENKIIIFAFGTGEFSHHFYPPPLGEGGF